MTDVFSPKKRSAIMSLIRSAKTGPERSVQKALRGLGQDFQVNAKDLPGSPDIALASKKTAIFVHGCFWHQHPGCPRSTMPRTNRNYWKPKLANNQARDRRSARLIRSKGWTAATIWECQTKDSSRLNSRLNTIFKIAGHSRG